MEFDFNKINDYSVEELLDYLKSGQVTFDDLQKCSLSWKKLERVKNELNKLDSVSIPDIPLPDNSQLYADLFDDMRANKCEYSSHIMRLMFGISPSTEEMRADDSPRGRFLKAGLHLNLEMLYDNGFLPERNHELEKAIFKNEIGIYGTHLEDYGEFPSGRTDLFCIGVPDSGKSCVLLGMLHSLFRQSEMRFVAFDDSIGNEESRRFYEAAIRFPYEYKPPCSDPIDYAKILKLDIGPKLDREITVVDLSGEAYAHLSNGYPTREREGITAYQCLGNNNPKILFFILDYNILVGKSQCFSNNQQGMFLNNVLSILSSDGEGDGSKNCTMSKVQNVVVIVNKSDLMDAEKGRKMTLEERNDLAFDFLHRYYANFMNHLTNLCRKYGINSNNKNRYQPFFTTFSLGNFFLGNTFVFDETDSSRLARFLVESTQKRHGGLFRLFQNNLTHNKRQ